MKFILISDAVKLTGLDRQTIRNWITKGIIPSQKINGTFYVDQDTFEALAEPMRDVDNARKRLGALKDAYLSEKDLFYAMRESVRDEHNTMRFLSVCINNGIRTRFFEAMVRILHNENLLTEKEAEILIDLLNGTDYNMVAQKNGLSRERIRQIAEKAVHRCGKLTRSEDTDAIRAKDEEIESLKDEISILKKMVYRQAVNHTEDGLTDAEKRLVRMDALDLHALLSKNLYNEDVSVRALNGLLCNNVRTVGDLCQITRESIIQQRNIGKKTVDELTAFLASKGLEWGMNIDKVKELKL